MSIVNDTSDTAQSAEDDTVQGNDIEKKQIKKYWKRTRKCNKLKINRSINEPCVKQSKQNLCDLEKNTSLENDQVKILNSIFLSFDRENEIYNYSKNDLKECLSEVRTEDECIQFLRRRCAVCYQLFARSSIITMVICHCEVCVQCFRSGYTLRANENIKSLWAFTCLICSKPKNILSEPIHTEILLNLLQQHANELVRKYSNSLADLSFQKMNGYLKCSNCNNEFLVADSHQTKQSIPCTYCNNNICVKCGKIWTSDQHYGLNGKTICGSKEILRNSGKSFETVTCPKCKMCFELARGGCLHLQCSSCRHEFCQSCYKPMFREPNQCADCVKLAQNGRQRYFSLHAHHPRNCLYYLRDLSPNRLITLLNEYNVNWRDHKHDMEKTLCSTANNANSCQVVIQDDDKADTKCAAESSLIDNRICEMHLKEFLVKLIKSRKIDPVNAYEIKELKQIISRSTVKIPSNSEERTDLIAAIRKYIPINDDDNSRF